MSDINDQASVAGLIAQGRQKVGLSLGQLAETTGISKTELFRLERGQRITVNPSMLQTLSEPLQIPLADLYDAAGYQVRTDLPTFAPYLRSKYGGLPESAKAELERSFRTIAKKHGYDPNGPAPGEDET